MSLADRDFEAFFSIDEHATNATAGGVTFPVLFDQYYDPTYMRDMFDYQTERVGLASQSRQVQAMGKTDEIPDLSIGAIIKINGVDYQLLKIYLIEDGKISRLELVTNYEN